MTPSPRTRATAPEIVLIDTTGPTTTIRVTGELDARSSAAAATSLVRLAKAAPTLLHIDATDTQFMDSSGISALAMVALAVTNNGGTVTMTASPTVSRVITLCGMQQHLGLAQP